MDNAEDSDVQTAIRLLIRYVIDEFPPNYLTPSQLIADWEWQTHPPATAEELAALRRIEDRLPKPL